MEEGKKPFQHPGKLNFNLPLLSTKRPPALFNAGSDQTNIQDTSNMVPFSWERIPGEPKDKKTSNIDIPLPPRLPPARWQPPLPDDYDDQFCNLRDHGNSSEHNNDRGYASNNERLTDTIDIFSLAESVDDDVDYEATNDRISAEDGNSYYHSPNFIIQRFLPDAQALAEASVVNKKLPLPGSPYFNPTFSRFRQPYGSPKGCGLGSFFPWRMKPKPCSDKSPVCDAIIGPNHKHHR